MKVIPAKNDFEKLLHRHRDKENKFKLRNDGTAELLSLMYLAFAKEVAAEVDKLLFIDNSMVMKSGHMLAASKTMLNKYSYAQVIGRKLKKVEANNSEETDETDEENETASDVTDTSEEQTFMKF